MEEANWSEPMKYVQTLFIVAQSLCTGCDAIVDGRFSDLRREAVETFSHEVLCPEGHIHARKVASRSDGRRASYVVEGCDQSRNYDCSWDGALGSTLITCK